MPRQSIEKQTKDRARRAERRAASSPSSIETNSKHDSESITSVKRKGKRKMLIRLRPDRGSIDLCPLEINSVPTQANEKLEQEKEEEDDQVSDEQIILA